MIVFNDTKDFKIKEPTVVTLGKFDGRHRGHQKLLREMLDISEEYGYKTAIFTFSTAPVAMIEGGPQEVITTNQERRNNMEKMGIDYLVEYPFTKEASGVLPEDFLRQILLEQMNARVIVVGTDCGFGYQRSGDVKFLLQCAPQYGYQLKVVTKAREDDRDISSTYVKEELDRGNIEKVNELLGEPYSIHGIVVHGNHIGGSLLGFPTVNILPPEEKCLPPFGVYVSRVIIKGSCYGGITNIGRKPTIEGESPVGVETHVFDFNSDVYGENIEVQLLTFVRPERKFESLDALKEQLERDKEYGLEYLGR